MKTHRRLWEDFISPENFALAAKKALRGKRISPSIRRYLENPAEKLETLRQWVARGEFKTSPYRIMRIFEPKERLIYILPFYPDHIVHHALINILGPIWHKTFISDSYACIPGRGLHMASQRTMAFVRRNQFVLQCDIRKFYPNINHRIMMDIVARKIGDKKILDILDNIIKSVGGDKNIPIGNLTSQWLGNVYLNELDHFVKQTLRWRDYIRYCDDFCLFGNNKQELHGVAVALERFIDDHLGLWFSKCNLATTRHGVDYIGYRHFRDFILLRRRSAKKIKQRLMTIARTNNQSAHAVGQLAAAKGWMKWACAYNYQQHIKHCIRMTYPNCDTAFLRRAWTDD